jgi:hypothetical protein
MEAHWDETRGFCVPNPSTYPHLWLWDSCFHAVVWAHLGDPRATRELAAVLAGQLTEGLVPHMRYAGSAPDTWLGPVAGTSSLSQPPMFAHAAKVLAEHGFTPGAQVLARARRGLDWIWSRRRTHHGLLYVVHPWEAGNDHSPRWDDWGAPGRTALDYDQAARTAWNKQRMDDLTFHDDGAAAWSSTFVVAPAAFNAYAAFNMAELAHLLDDPELARRAASLADAMDVHLWDEEQQLWDDLAIVGGGPSVRVPISDGVMGALATADRGRALAALDQLEDPQRFAAEFGPTNVARHHPAYDPAAYWRGAAWPHLSYLLWLAERRWGRTDRAAALADRTVSGALASGWAEYWNPETGEGLGATPQSWTALVVAMDATAAR